MHCLDDIRRIYMREGPVARAAIVAFFVAAVIYGGGKPNVKVKIENVKLEEAA